MKIGETLDAEQVIYGEFEVQPAPAGAPGESRGSLKISARIMDRRRLRQSAEFAETGAIEDLSTIEAHLAWQALALVAPKLAPEESEFRSLRSPIRLDAEERITSAASWLRLRSSARSFSYKPRAWTPVSPIRNTNWARFITSARNTARPPIGCKRSAPMKWNRIRPLSCWAWLCFNLEITQARRRRCKPSPPRCR